MLLEAEFWVAIAFVIFLGILGYLGVHRKVLEALDRGTARIRQELDQVRGLKEESEAVLQEARRKRSEAEREVQQIMDSARAESQRLTANAKTQAEDFIRRQTKLAEIKIARAELDAVAEVRAAAAEAAVAAAREILTDSIDAKGADRLLVRGIEAVKAELGNRSS